MAKTLCADSPDLGDPEEHTKSLMSPCLVGGFCNMSRVERRLFFSWVLSSTSRIESMALREGGMGTASVAHSTREAILKTRHYMAGLRC